MLARLQQTRFNTYFLWLAVLAVVVAIGAAGGLIVVVKGLSVTNLTDIVPWGIWIGIDLSSIALAAGAFTFCAVVYLLKLKEFEPMAKTAAYIGIVGYSMAMMCLFLDIGRPDRFYHGFIYWNIHSVLWEVTMCVGLYFTVLTIENLPTIAEFQWLKDRFPALTEKMKGLHKLAPYLAIAGLVLSCLHQSSLGAMYGVLINRPIWYRPGLSVLFFFSAMIGGVALTSAATIIVGRLKPETKVKDELIQRVVNVLRWGMLAFLYWRLWDMFAMTYTPQPGRMEGLSLLTSGPLSFNLWFGEILLGLLVPIILFFHPRTRENKNLRFLGLLLTVGGLIAYRYDTAMVGQLIVQKPYEVLTPLYATYFPSIVEIMAGAGIVAFGFLAFTLGVQYLKVVDHTAEAHH